MKTQRTFTKKSILLLLFTLITTIATYAQQVINTTLQFDGRTREYRLYVPQSYNPNNPVPLILNYHGFTNTIDIQYNQSNFQQLAEDNQFIFATPQGLGSSAGWAINNSFGGSEDDLGFSNALIDKIQEDYNINEKRIYATGFSNGGYFSYRLACELSSRIAAIASVAGSMTASWIDNGQCQPVHPTPILQITGTSDGVIPISGGFLGKSIQDVMEYWSDYNNGDSSPDVISLGSGSTRSIWDNGDNGVTVEFISVGGKGHSWIGGNVSTSQEIWDFFSRFDIDGEIDPSSPPVDDVCLGNVSSFPYNQSFEGNIGDWEQATDDDLNWTVDSNGTPSTGTGPSDAVDGSSYIYLEVSGNGQGFPSKRGILNSPCINLSGLTTPRLQFSYHMIGSAVGNLTVEARINNTGSWTSIFSQTGEQGTGWNQADIALSEYAGQSSVQLRINAVSGSSWQGDIAIDALSISNGTDNPGGDCDQVDFGTTQITSFSNQDNDGTFEISGGGTGLILRNNTWKQIPFDYTITENTILEFEFTSTSQGEIHGVGFESDNTLTSTLYFEVHGTQDYGVTNFDNYSGSGTTTYTIPVGNFYTGTANRLVFINDNDAGSGNNSLFANVKVYEGSCNGSLSAKEIIAQLDTKEPIFGTEDEGIGAIKMTPNPTNDRFILTVNSESTQKISVSIYTTLGQKKHETVLNSGVNTISTKGLGLSSGIYVVKIQSEGSKDVVKKLIVK
ncbi:T9SS type A sorting domain-containing protein [Aquimarina pacifica]|uniref:T9SS type A sorting domain-containing protein n=1 Tax=Aquimarina pacifica TaxID=1296415 RepID=UPI000471E912|nr:alpha/beta fold hydrolase [Aquimarina pacifica]